jgi:hypothetical protein
MSLPDEVDHLVVQLAASLPAPQHAAFVAAAEAALAGIPCLGPGSAYRVLRELQRRYFDPPILNNNRGSVEHRSAFKSNAPPGR